MYQPASFRVDDAAALHALIDAHPLATWARVVGGELRVDHVPMLLDAARGPRGTLVGHVARANPIVAEAPGEALLVFHGPQGYVSPGWYASKREHGKVVPTWNYAVVHVRGTPRWVDDAAQVRAIVERLTARHEAAQPHPWRVDDAPADFVEALGRAIVGVELPIDAIEGKFKLGQNRPPQDVDGVVAALEASAAGVPLAQAMRTARGR